MTGSADRRGPGGDDWSAGRYVPAQQQEPERGEWDGRTGPYPPGAAGQDGPAAAQQGQYVQQPGYGADPYGTGQYPVVDPYGGGQGPAGPYDSGSYPVVGVPQQGQPVQGQYVQQPGYGADPYGTGQYPVVDPYGGGQGPAGPYDSGSYPVVGVPQQGQPVQGQYVQQPGYGADPYGTGQYPVAQAYVTTQQPVQPDQSSAAGAGTVPQPKRPAEQPGAPSTAAGPAGASRKGSGPDGLSYENQEFTFVDDEEESEDVIDWLKFAETRSERRDERKRRNRGRVIALVVVLVLAAAGGVGYLWKTGTFGDSGVAAVPAAKRDVVVVHLHELTGRTTTALLVDDEAGNKGSALLLPDSLKLPGDGDSGTTTLGESLDGQGAGGTRDALATVLGANIAGTWRLDTPYLQILVDQLGGITVDTDARIVQKGKVLVSPGKAQELNGQAAVAYATYLGKGEQPAAQLARFGQVLYAVFKVMPQDGSSAVDTVKRMNAVMDPSLSEQQLGAALAALGKLTGAGHFSVKTLPVKADGTLDEAAAGSLVKDVLGGTVHKADSTSGPARVSIQDATGVKGRAADAQLQVVNGGSTFVPPLGKASAPVAHSEIRYTDDARAGTARQLALTLDLPATAVQKSAKTQTADIVVVLGEDYKGVPETDPKTDPKTGQ